MLGKYDILQPLSREEYLYLVRNPENGEILTARQIEESQYEVYERLYQAYRQGKRLSHQPAVKEIIPFEAEHSGNTEHTERDGKQENKESRYTAYRRNVPGTYLVYEQYVEGENLQTVLDARGVLSSEKARCYMEQLCDALTDLHNLGIIHRDVKPENVLIDRSDNLFLIDYDIARTTKEEATRDTRLLGTQGYAAPEQFGFQQTDARTDLYGAGVLYNMMLTGAFPQKKLADGIDGMIIGKCICLDPADRFADARALKEAISKVQENVREASLEQRAKICRIYESNCYEKTEHKKALAGAERSKAGPASADEIEEKLIKILRWVPGFQICRIYTVIPVLLFYFESYIQIKAGLIVARGGGQKPIIVVGMWVIYFGSFLFACDYLHIRRFFLRRFDKCRWYVYFLFCLLWEMAFIAVTILVVRIILRILVFSGVLA